MAGGTEIVDVQLPVAADVAAAVERFHHETLGVSPSTLSFVEAPDGTAPFFHFALLVPGDRFAAAAAWLGDAAPLLPRRGSTETTYRFEAWDADAAYALDPAGNIVEVIAHRGRDESGRGGPFAPDELRGISELGLVTADAEPAAARLAEVGLPVWSGAVADPGADQETFAFLGRRAHTLILCSPGRGWLPTGRPAEIHPLRATLLTDAGRLTVELDADGGLAVDRGAG